MVDMGYDISIQLSFSIYLLAFEIFILLWIKFYEDSFYRILGDIEFWMKVFCGFVCYLFFFKGSVITEINSDGEIVRQVFIGK